MSKLIDIDLVLPYLRCDNCGEYFKGDAPYGCASGHTVCSLCREEDGNPAACKVDHSCQMAIARI